MLRGLLTVGGWTMVSRMLGLVRDQLIAAFMGAGPVADAFFVALRLPNLFRRLFGEGAFNAAFIPVFSGLLTAEGPDVARRFAEQAMAVLAFWLLLLTIAGEVFMPQVMHVLASGYARDPAKFALTVELSRITFPYLVLICLAALVAGVLNGLDRFAAASGAYVLFNVVGIASIFALAPFTPTMGHALAWGVTLSGVAQLAVLLWAARRAGMALHPPRPRLTPQMRLLMRRMVPGLVAGGVTQLNLVVDGWVSTMLPAGTVSLLYYADRVNQLPLGVLGAAVGTALLPVLSRQVLAGDARAAADTQNRAIEYALVLTLPAAAALIATAGPVMAALFGRGAFSVADTQLSAQSLAAYATGLPAFVLVKVLAPAFFARGDTATPVRIGMACLGLNLVLNLALMRPLQHVGPPLATSIAASANLLALGFVLRRRGQLALDRRLVSRAGRMVAATALMVAALLVARGVLPDGMAHGQVARMVSLGVLVGVGLGTYGAAAQGFGLMRVQDVVGAVLRRVRRKARQG
ncbi:MAG: murein biosynthesis integral membrane protein MurJ [Janthinobacterium lividum]